MPARRRHCGQTGAADKNILVMAHFDAWFYGALDNASGVATMLGLAEYFA